MKCYLRRLRRHRHDDVEGETSPGLSSLVLGHAGEGPVVLDAGAPREEEFGADSAAVAAMVARQQLLLHVEVVTQVDVVD